MLLCAFSLGFIFSEVILIYRGNQESPSSANSQDIPTQSWYPPSVIGSSRPSTPGGSSSGAHQRVERTESLSSSHGQPSPAEAAGIISRLKDKR